ncbi:hypothetical protein BA81_19154 [Bacillus safensis FO-36b]|uniref:PBECR4 domain-containing protein n=1 Tax=Bacillus TaxID=1386 RepID=UPI00045D3F2C|nr:MULTISPECIES: PBECR4 domain-containing protein [Bacillus]KDE25553.1 hypothetical protein BA81_19154 [Bacillus safensis FO-36b]MEC1042177.1 PBECR4 domain-containing protein [Bacillus altitudinis]MEC1091448.1 PBECR4 domain-containing protein [Bacillus altitudinis]
MYTETWASTFDGFKDESMNLHEFVLFFDKYIANKKFQYTTEDIILSSFTIDFNANQLPHLMGLQYWNNIHVKQPSKQYDLLKCGAWDIEFLKKADNGTFKEYRSRIESMPYLYSMLYDYNCEVRAIHSSMDSPFKRRKIDLIFQKNGSKLAFVLELRKKKSIEHIEYVPTSFSVYSRTSKALVGKHKKIIIKSIKID